MQGWWVSDCNEITKGQLNMIQSLPESKNNLPNTYCSIIRKMHNPTIVHVYKKNPLTFHLCTRIQGYPHSFIMANEGVPFSPLNHTLYPPPPPPPQHKTWLRACLYPFMYYVFWCWYHLLSKCSQHNFCKPYV